MRSLFPTDRPWPGWQLFLFRFIFIFLLLVLDPLAWAGAFIPANPVFSVNDAIRTGAVEWANEHFFHIRPTLIEPMASGDTSFVWASLCLSLCVSSIAAATWSFFDRQGNNQWLGYWFRTGIRYYVIAIAALYGSDKLSLSQMGRLSLNDMATPVGQLSLMRMCWYFMASSPPYQFFSGLMELMIALLLLHRKTVTLGLLLGLAVFANVMMLNFSYDIPVKIFSGELVLCCFVLLFRDYERVLAFLVLNKTAEPGRLYEPLKNGTWPQVMRNSLKLIFVFGVFIVPAWNMLKPQLYKSVKPQPAFRYGVYRVNRFVVNGDSTANGTSRRRRWTALIFDKSGQGGLYGDSTMFKYRYGRSSFAFRTDTTAPYRLILQSGFSDNPADPADSLNLFYEPLIGDSTRFRTKIGADSIYMEAHLTDTTYPLGKWQFHWLQEYVP